MDAYACPRAAVMTLEHLVPRDQEPSSAVGPTVLP